MVKFMVNGKVHAQTLEKIFEQFDNALSYLVTLLGRVDVLVVVLDASEDAEEDELLAGDADGGPGLDHARLYSHLTRKQAF